MSATAGKPVTCKAMVMMSKGAELTQETVFVAPPKAGEVRVKILSSGVCHTDWSEPRNFPSEVTPKGSKEPGFPCILGHEGGGVIESVGEGVTSVKPGDHIICLYIAECRNCENCLSGKTNLCTATDDTQGNGHLLDGTSRFSMKGKGAEGDVVEVLHFMGVSSFSEYTVLPEISVAKINKEADLDKVGICGCGMTTGYGAAKFAAKVEPGTYCAVFGVGGVGLAVIMGLKECGAKMIIAIDKNKDKEKKARELGATHFVNPDDIAEGDTLAGTVWCTAGRGLDYCFECIGNTHVMSEALRCVHEGWGHVQVIGVAGQGQVTSTKPLELVLGKTWSGSAFGKVRGRTMLPTMIDDYLAGRPPYVDEFVDRIIPSEKVNDAFEYMKKGQTLSRTVIQHKHEGDSQVADIRLANKKAAIIFMHGLGDAPSSWQSSVEWLASKLGRNKRAVKAVCPAAPMRSITKSEGEVMTGWMDVLQDWPRKVGDKDDTKGIAVSVQTIHKTIDKLIAENGIDADQIFVCGFSQGAAVALSSVYSYSKKLAGCIALSGWLPSPHEKFSDANSATPLFIGHGEADEIVQVANADEAAKELAATKPQVVKVPKLGHDTNEDEFDQLLKFLQANLK